jgi:hypothetical protein
MGYRPPRRRFCDQRTSALAINFEKFAGRTHPSTRHCCSEIIVISPVNSPGPCVAISRSPLQSDCTISIVPESRMKKTRSCRRAETRFPHGQPVATCPDERDQSAPPSIGGKVCVAASRALVAAGQVDMFVPGDNAAGDFCEKCIGTFDVA